MDPGSITALISGLRLLLLPPAETGSRALKFIAARLICPALLANNA